MSLVQYYTPTILLVFIAFFLINKPLSGFTIFVNEVVAEFYVLLLDATHSLVYFLLGIVFIMVQLYIYNILPLFGPLFNITTKENPSEPFADQLITNNLDTSLTNCLVANAFTNTHIAEAYSVKPTFYTYKLVRSIHAYDDTNNTAPEVFMFNHVYSSKLDLFYTQDLLPLLVFLGVKNEKSNSLDYPIHNLTTLPITYKGTHHNEATLALPNYLTTTASILKTLEHSTLTIINKNLQNNIMFGRNFR